MTVNIDELLNRQLRLGKLHIQCREHVLIDICDRPDNCVLCRADQRRMLERVIAINEFLTWWQHDAKAVIKELRK